MDEGDCRRRSRSTWSSGRLDPSHRRGSRAPQCPWLHSPTGPSRLHSTHPHHCPAWRILNSNSHSPTETAVPTALPPPRQRPHSSRGRCSRLGTSSPSPPVYTSPVYSRTTLGCEPQAGGSSLPTSPAQTHP